MRRFVLATLLIASFPFAQRPAEVQAAARYQKVHVNWYIPYNYVEVNDLSKPIFRVTEATPILKDRFEYKTVRWEETFETKIVPRYETRTERYVAYYDERPLYETRSETYVAYYNEYPIMGTRQESYLVGYNHERVVIGYEPTYSTRQVCTFRWRGSCREWGTERYQSGQRPIYGTRSTPVYGTRTVSYVVGIGRTPVYATRTYTVRVGTARDPVYATRTYSVRVGTARDPVYATRTVTEQVGTTTVRVSAGLSPVKEWVKVCSACEIEGYNPPTKVLVGYEKKTVTQPGPEKQLSCDNWGGCDLHGRMFIEGAWHEYSHHKDFCQLNGVNVSMSLCLGGGGGGRTTTSTKCEDRDPPEETAPDGSCYTPQTEVDVCRDGKVVKIPETQRNPLTDTASSPCPVPPVCPDGTKLAGQPIPADDNCSPVTTPPPVCPDGTKLAGQPIPADDNCNPVTTPPPRRPINPS